MVEGIKEAMEVEKIVIGRSVGGAGHGNGGDEACDGSGEWVLVDVVLATLLVVESIKVVAEVVLVGEGWKW